MGAYDARTEEELVRAATVGDLGAFDVLVRRYRAAAMVVARQILRSKELAEDAAQDGLVTAYKALPQLKDPSRFGSWLFAIVRNRCIRLAQGKEEQHERLDDFIAQRLPSLQEAVPSVSFDCLPDELRAVVELYYGSEWSVGEISRFTGLPGSTVKWRLHAARKHLRQRLEWRTEE